MNQFDQNNHLRKSIKRSFDGIIIGYSQLFATRIFGLYQKMNGGYEVQRKVDFKYEKIYLFIANHQSRIDPFVAFATLGFKEDSLLKPARFMTARGIYFSFLRPILKLLGCYPTRRRKDWDSVSQSADFLRRGYSVMIFPEGRRTLQSESDPRPGIERMLAVTPDFVTPVLIHIEWKITGRFKKRPIVRMAEASLDDLRKLSAKEIMQLVYEV